MGREFRKGCVGFPGGSSGKEPTCQCRRLKRHGFDPWVRKIPWRGEWEQFQKKTKHTSTDEWINKCDIFTAQISIQSLYE